MSTNNTRPQRTPREYATLVVKGICMGASDIVPGVSGGTMAFILGIYEELIDSIRALGQPSIIQNILQNIRQQQWRQAEQLINWPFLVAVASGIFIAILTLAPSLEWVLESYPVYLWSFFFGLVLASAVTVSRRIDKWSPQLLGGVAAGTLFAYLIVGLVPAQTPDSWWFLILSGALAISAMILPGLSGAFILLLLGKYQFVLSAVNNFDIVSIGLVGIGAGVGIISVAQVLGWLFNKYHDITVAILIGFMVGSLRKVWPWKEDVAWLMDINNEFIVRHGERIVTQQENLFPPLGTDLGQVAIAFLLALVGFGLVLFIEWLANQDSH
ncbi:MAG TPA: DUF368 domain-containing protein [Anaerolineae bacterium]|nr:DUF368 domain-containing protein [Anaerolineae bacterium]